MDNPTVEASGDVSRGRVESVVLTGGASTRMGTDKASVLVDGVALGERIAAQLAEAGFPPTILGPAPIRGLPFQQDEHPQDGPLAALRAFHPTAPLVFVVACDLPLFDSGIVAVMLGALGQSDAAVASVGGRLQPLCALYRAEAFDILRGPLSNARSMMAFLDALEVVEVSESDWVAAGLHPACVRGANTPHELREILGTGE